MARKKAPISERPARPAAEYDAFERLTRKLVKVPKSEIDAERAKQNGKKPNR